MTINITQKEYSLEFPVLNGPHWKSHVTLLYLGKQLEDQIEEAEVHELLAMLPKEPFKVRLTLRTDTFGPEHKPVKVLKIADEYGIMQLKACNYLARGFFFSKGIESTSTFTNYNPHMTLYRPKDADLAGEIITLNPPVFKEWETNVQEV